MPSRKDHCKAIYQTTEEAAKGNSINRVYKDLPLNWGVTLFAGTMCY